MDWKTAAVTVCLAATGVAAEPVFYHDVNVSLSNALVRGNGTPANIELYLGVTDVSLPATAEAWNPNLMGWAGVKMTGWQRGGGAFCAMDHNGTIADVSGATGKVKLAVDVTVNPDPWVKGGEARYVLELERDGPKVSGSFAGTFKGREVKGPVAGTIRAHPWPKPDSTYSMHAPGEHPRLIFRKSDLPALRARAKTPEGKALLARLDAVLAQPWTLWHPMGYAFKYQITGDEKWAVKARQEIDAARGGRRQKDSRYSYTGPNGKLRAGPSYAAMAMAYDLLYDRLDPAYRKALARELQNKVWGQLAYKTGGGQHSPRSNHYGAWQGGGGTVILAITGDEGTDPEIIDAANRLFRQRAKRAFYDGYGSKAYFFEGHHCGRLSTNTGLSNYLQALRVACGEDWITPYPPAQWLLTKWVYELVRSGGELRNCQRGMYARAFERGGLSSGGDFAQGFGICPESHKPAVLWTFNHVVQPGETKDFDSINYPHRSVYAFVNWPVGVAEANPATILPKVHYDELAEYYIFRNGWKGEGDVIVTAIGGKRHKKYAKEDVFVLGMGVKGALPIDFPHLRGAVMTDNGDDSYVLSHDSTSLAVDFSGASGGPALIAAAGPGASAHIKKALPMKVFTAGGRKISISVVGEGTSRPRVQGDAVVIGKRTIRFDGKTLTLGTE